MFRSVTRAIAVPHSSPGSRSAGTQHSRLAALPLLPLLRPDAVKTLKPVAPLLQALEHVNADEIVSSGSLKNVEGALLGLGTEDRRKLFRIAIAQAFHYGNRPATRRAYADFLSRNLGHISDGYQRQHSMAQAAIETVGEIKD